MVFQCINIHQVPSEVLKTAASGLGFQHLPRDMPNVNAWKIMFDPYNRILENRVQLKPEQIDWRGKEGGMGSLPSLANFIAFIRRASIKNNTLLRKGHNHKANPSRGAER